jgi:hypothetical protein
MVDNIIKAVEALATAMNNLANAVTELKKPGGNGSHLTVQHYGGGCRCHCCPPGGGGGGGGRGPHG